MIVEGQAAYLLHTRKYTDSKLLLDLLTPDYGRICAVYRRQRSAKSGGQVQAFTPLEIDWKGNSSLKTITSLEASGRPYRLISQALYCGFYINEVLERLLAQDDPGESLFSLYARTVSELDLWASNSTQIYLERVLRRFELELLDELGFGVNFFEDIAQVPITPNGCVYQYIIGEGFTPVLADARNTHHLFPAEVLIALGAKEFSDPSVLKYAKRLCREVFKPILGVKPIKARELFGR